ncbi:putative acyldehydrogenase [Phaeomoniella chlamydospora]|uniref:Putative acyldehydrogenase n=1 Tax=Phaeomoniella chlamydospora TaxID=158046 RepID=A0A0G2HAK5_PHACM|nr:putative acyldehydrogenase [Phaeomoniella chlamydospora]
MRKPNAPSLHPLTTFGEENRVNPLRTGEGWRKLKDIGISAGIVAHGYGHSGPGQSGTTWNKRVVQFATIHLWAGSAALTTCPAAMTDGAAVLLGRHLSDPEGDQPGRSNVLQGAYRRLISFDPTEAWTSGQWMTERTGGSDVSQTESRASRLDENGLTADFTAFNSDEDGVGMPLGPWRVDGFKWFSSATDADMVVLLARTSKGISTFYAPMRRKCGSQIVLNGVRMVRLKEKLGTKGLPTAEVEIKGMRAWLIGEEGRGVKEISAVLNSTRLWTASGAVGYWTRGLAVARAYSRVRIVKGALLTENKQHVAWMAQETIEYRASAHLIFLGAALQGVGEQISTTTTAGTKARSFLPSRKSEADLLLRVLTPVMKAQCSLAAVDGLRACMEALGGVGYCENNFDGGVMNVARLFRDANVNCIWEGTTSVMAEDLVRALKGREGPAAQQALDGLIKKMLQSSHGFQDETLIISEAWTTFNNDIATANVEELQYRGREILRKLECVLCGCLLMFDATQDSDEVAAAIAKRWIATTLGQGTRNIGGRWKDEIAMDRAIFLSTTLQRAHL